MRVELISTFTVPLIFLPALQGVLLLCVVYHCANRGDIYQSRIFCAPRKLGRRYEFRSFCKNKSQSFDLPLAAVLNPINSAPSWWSLLMVPVES